MTSPITLIDYEIGNLFNLKRAFEHLGHTCSLVKDTQSIESAERLVLPGVGAFGEGITNLERLGLIGAIKGFAETGKPMMGICLGMQLLFSHSEELGSWKGLDIIQGHVRRFPNGNYKLPQISWNTLEATSPWDGTILDALPHHVEMYFNHSFYVDPVDTSVALASTPYAGMNFTSVVKHKNIFACQFHPERSAEFGLKLLSNFGRIQC